MWSLTTGTFCSSMSNVGAKVEASAEHVSKTDVQCHAALQSQKAVAAYISKAVTSYFSSKQLLRLGFARERSDST